VLWNSKIKPCILNVVSFIVSKCFWWLVTLGNNKIKSCTGSSLMILLVELGQFLHCNFEQPCIYPWWLNDMLFPKQMLFLFPKKMLFLFSTTYILSWCFFKINYFLLHHQFLLIGIVPSWLFLGGPLSNYIFPPFSIYILACHNNLKIEGVPFVRYTWSSIKLASILHRIDWTF
jgi:hypothetical protein